MTYVYTKILKYISNFLYNYVVKPLSSTIYITDFNIYRNVEVKWHNIMIRDRLFLRSVARSSLG